ncbi:MAG: hypothetical protein KDK91_33395, partial [Gammaproteobacteria bacterium]|nr:hypothetical protein [Gammaproteobacteria bacterium]
MPASSAVFDTSARRDGLRPVVTGTLDARAPVSLRRRRLFGLAALPLLVLFLGVSACSLRQLAYNYADWLLVSEVESYIELEPAQRAWLTEALTERLESHRRLELPALIALVEQAIALVGNGVERTEARTWLVNAEKLIKHTVSESLPIAARLLNQLSATQAASLPTSFERANQTFIERHWLHLPTDERLRRRAESTIEQVEEWTGELTDSQREQVLRIRNAMPDSAAQWLAFGRVKQQGVLRILVTERVTER